MDVSQVSPETNNRVEEAIPLTDLWFTAVVEYLKHHRLQVERFEWNEDGSPTLYCEHRGAESDSQD